MKRTSFLILPLFFLLTIGVCAQDAAVDSQYAIKAKPLIQPCEELKDGEDAGLAKTIKDLATADAAGKIRLAGELGNSCHKKSVEPLLAILQDKDPLVRVAVVEALAKLGDEAAIDPLIEVIQDSDWRVRFAVGPALCAFQKQKPSYSALNYLGVGGSTEMNENDARARCITFLALEQMRDVNFSRKPLFYLFSLSESKDEAVRKIARETLMAFKDTRNGTHELIGLLKQSLNPNYRRNCAYWLGQLKVERARDLLTEVAANDADESVKKAAAEALKLLGPSEEEASTPTKATPTKAAASSKARNATKAAPKAPTKKPITK